MLIDLLIVVCLATPAVFYEVLTMSKPLFICGEKITSKFHGPGIHGALSTLCVTDLHRHFRGRHSRERVGGQYSYSFCRQ